MNCAHRNLLFPAPPDRRNNKGTQPVPVLSIDPSEFLEERTALVDSLAVDAFGRFLAPAMEAEVALIAVGGYGRRQLFPYSDVDLLVLTGGRVQPPAFGPGLSAFLRHLWDAGLRISHSVRTPAECSELNDSNIELTISLLDQRFLAGDAQVHADLLERLPRFIAGQRETLVRHLCRMTRERHAVFQNTIHHLEPNVKETPGGLRDLQLLSWLAQLGQATPARMLERERQFLFSLRYRLHCEAGRDQNVLTFDAQERLFADPAAGMGEYFRTARGIYRAAIRLVDAGEARHSSLFAQFRNSRSRLSTPEFTVSRERVLFREPGQLASNPLLTLRLFQFVARHGIPLAVETEERVAARLEDIRAYFRESRPVWFFIEEILSLPHAAAALHGMHETGILTAIFPELQPIECLVIRDFHHRYTVDEHTLVAIQTLTQLRAAEETSARPFADLYGEIEKPSVLLFALLFHDAGKAAVGIGHEALSVKAAESAMDRIQTPGQERDMVRRLIGCHLEMSAAMNGRDMSDPATARDMAQRTGTVEMLKYLTLMTFADVSAVNPAVMTPWRAEQLWRLYLITYNELTRALDAERISSGEAAPAPFLEGFPVRYLRTHSEADIEAHRILERASQEHGVTIDLARPGSAWRLTLIAGDRPFLFASIAGTLSSFGMNILKAEAFANRHGTVLDTFTFSDPHRTLELNPSEAGRLKSTVQKVALGSVDVKQLLKGRPAARQAGIEPSVHINNDASGSATLIQIVAGDRPALLYDLASALSAEGCNIEVVLIDTEAHKAIDVFYVTADGAKLTVDRQEIVRQTLLRAMA